MTSLNNLSLVPVQESEIPELYSLEIASYPDDEAASLDSLTMRALTANEFFLACKNFQNNSELVGFVNGTLTSFPVIHHETMSSHNPSGKNLVIHSVTVNPTFRRQGKGRDMLKEYVRMISVNRSVEKLFLLSKAYLIPFYISCGFSVVCQSAVSHGQEPWFEMHLNLADYRAIDQIQVDAFAHKPFSGNPAAVVFEHRDVQWMQNIANENNLAETAFLQKEPDEEHAYFIRWFTPSTEVDLCGHATLASAHALYETKRETDKLQTIKFRTLNSGILTATGKEDGTIELNFPATKPTEYTFSTQELQTFVSALSITAKDVIYVGKSPYDLFVEIDALAFAKLNLINYSLLAEFGGRGVIITCLGGKRNGLGSVENTEENVGMTANSPVFNKEYDFVSRFFAPCCAINEDPVTGSAHCAIAPYWFEKTGTADGTVLTFFQASPRGGVLQVTLEVDRVKLAGNSITTMRTKIVV